MSSKYDVLIIGSGAAGLALALSLASNSRVALLSKDNLLAGSSSRAQGGIAAVMNQTRKNLDAHVQDTIKAGAGLCDSSTVEFTVKKAKDAVEWLIDQGVQFTTTDNNVLHLTQEGGHSQRRILHAADKTGAAVVNTLNKQVLKHPNITCLTQHTAIDLIIQNKQCIGADVLDNAKNQHTRLLASFTVLATGGASQVYAHTSNPDAASGDGIAIAWRAGCRVANLEFNQFHPTCLYQPDTPPFLITEVIRGEGGKLRLPNGDYFMHHYHEDAELAPRDVVARAIDSELKKNNIDCVYLDISHRDADFIREFFPTIHAYCLKRGIDITKEAIPVVPAAHYTCGGVITDLQGQTDISKLYAIGEVAHTGLHGANRMASNSLLECLVFAASAGESIRKQLSEQQAGQNIDRNEPKTKKTASPDNITALIQELRHVMWNKVGIVRSKERLDQAYECIKQIKEHVDEQFKKGYCDKTLLECRNLACVAQLMIESAQARKESRGLHYTTDYPNLLDNPSHTILSPQYDTRSSE